MSIGFIAEWFDIWVGFYYNKEKHRLYFFPVPMLGIYIDFKVKRPYKHEPELDFFDNDCK